MKTWLILAAALLLLSSPGAFAEERLIMVNGVGEKSLDPNMVNLTVEVWSKAPSAKQAQQLAANQFKNIKKSFDDFKIKKEDMQTDSYSLSPEYEYDQKTRQNKMTGFRVSQSLSVTLRKVEDAGNFIDALVSDKKTTDSGVSLNSIAWDSDKRLAAETATLAEAVRAAKIKAEEIAKAAGVRIKGVSKISHTTSAAGPRPAMREMGLMKMSADSAATEVAAGQIKVRVEVIAEYEIN
ncbi:MAG: SIMPL domain-containing protein [Bdellovibrio sp.]|nr:SIMPL domain-containing protein [Bdellovibrio sp.]